MSTLPYPFPVTPWNTWSNAAYPLAGLVHLLVDPSWENAALLLLQATLGYCSYRYHKAPGPYTNRLDWSAMYGVQGYLALLGWYPVESWIALSGVIFGTLLAAFFVWRYAKVFRRFNWHMGALFLLAAVPAFLWGNRALALWSTGLFAVGFLCWQLERRAGWREGHGFWHLLTAAGQAVLRAAR